MAYPVEPKTQAAGVAAAVSGAALYLLQTYVFKGDVPAGVQSLVYAAVPGVLAFAVAYLAPHQHRDPAPALVVPAGSGPPVVLSSSASLSEVQMAAIRDALATIPPPAADEPAVPPAP
jgi:hypothetical protein